MAEITQRTATVAEVASGTSVTGTLPPDKVSTDLVIVQFTMTCTPAQFTGPGGAWTEFVEPTDTTDGRMIAAYWQVNPSAAPVGTTSVSDGHTAICHAFAGVDPSTPIDVSAQITASPGSGSTTIECTGVTTVTDGAFVLTGVVGATKSRVLTVSPWTMITQYSAAGVGRAGGLAGDIKTTAGATGSATWGNTDEVSIRWAGYVTALRPASAGPPPFNHRPMRIWRL